MKYYLYLYIRCIAYIIYKRSALSRKRSVAKNFRYW